MEKILVENFGDGVTLITINRPTRKNAVCSQTAIEVQQAFAEFDRSQQKVAVFTGAGDDAFCAGADLADRPEFWRCTPTVGITTLKPIIAAVGGYCIGGGVVFTMMADLAIASDNATFYYPEAKLGLSGGIIASLAGRIPHKFAMEFMLLGRKVNAQRAAQMGLVNEVVPKGRHVEAALAMARELTGSGPLVLQMLKRSVNRDVLGHSASEDMARAQIELAVIRDSADLQEGIAAFREKRPPKFQGS